MTCLDPAGAPWDYQAAGALQEAKEWRREAAEDTVCEFCGRRGDTHEPDCSEAPDFGPYYRAGYSPTGWAP